MIQLIVLFPNGVRQEVLLAGVPRVGEHIRLKNGPEAVALIVEHVLWMEVSTEPVVIISVRPNPNAPSA